MQVEKSRDDVALENQCFQKRNRKKTSTYQKILEKFKSMSSALAKGALCVGRRVGQGPNGVTAKNVMGTGGVDVVAWDLNNGGGAEEEAEVEAESG